MRITIDTDDKGNVKIDTGESGADKPTLFQSTPDIPVIDGGQAPIQEAQRQSNVAGAEAVSVSASASRKDREAELPLNPLRAGAAAAYQSPANLRKMAAHFGATSAAVPEPSINAIDAGPARVPKKSPDAPSREKGGKRDKKK